MAPWLQGSAACGQGQEEEGILVYGIDLALQGFKAILDECVDSPGET